MRSAAALISLSTSPVPRLTLREDLGEIRGKCAARHDLIAAGLPGGLDRRGVDVRDEAEGADTCELGVGLERRQRGDRVGFRTVQIEDDQ